MVGRSAIEWTNITWNVLTGCDKISPGCKYCYAESYAQRLKNMGVKKYRNAFKLTFHPETINYPFTKRKKSLKLTC
jgi:protein gp37